MNLRIEGAQDRYEGGTGEITDDRCLIKMFSSATPMFLLLRTVYITFEVAIMRIISKRRLH